MKTKYSVFKLLFYLLFAIPNIVFATSVIVTNTNNSGAGSLRQAIIDANANPVDSIIFQIPLSDPGYIASRGVFRIAITGSELAAITRANLVVDGTTQTLFTGNTNPVMLGLGGTVGVDSIPMPKIAGPEIEIVDMNNDTTGINIAASYVKVRGLCIYGFGNSFSPGHGNIIVQKYNLKHITIENNVLGVPADQLIKPDSTLLTGGCNIIVYFADSGLIRNNLIAWSGSAGTYLNQCKGWIIEYNELTSNGISIHNLDGSDLGYATKGHIERYNHSYNNIANGFDSYMSYGYNTFENNTIENNGLKVIESSGIRIYGTNDYVHKNIIAANVGSGILVTSGADSIIISENSIYENGAHVSPYYYMATKAIGINLNNPTDNSLIGTSPYYTLNDYGDYDLGGNGLLNYPVITKASIINSNLVVEGFTEPGSNVEFFIGDTSSVRNYPQGKTFLFSKVEGSADDLDNTTGSYGPLPINGINQGQDSTNKFKFIVPINPSKLHNGDIITSTATLNKRTSEFSPAAQCMAGTNLVLPVFDCVYKNYNGSYTAVFGYNNPSASTLNIPISNLNQFIPVPQNQGQPVSFLSGNHDMLFSVPFTGNSLTWQLDSTSITVTPTSNQCQVDLGVTKTLSYPDPNSNDTIFKGDTVTFTIKVKNYSNYFPTCNVSLLDTLPSAFTFVSSNASSGTYNNVTGLWNIATLNSLDSATLTIKAIVDTSSQNDVYIISQSQPDPNPMNDHSFAGVTMSSSSSGNNGGLESNGNLASQIAIRNFLRNKEQLKDYNNSSALEPFLNNTDVSSVQTSKLKSTQSTDLVGFIPSTGPANSSAFISTPTDLLGVSNAIEVFSVDYFTNNTDRKAAILGIATPADNVYGHTKVVCDRLNGATLENINHIIIKGYPFIISKLVQDNGDVDYSVSFIAFKNGSQYTIDNRWNLREYKPYGNNPVLNFQVWSTSESSTANLVSAILDKINTTYSLKYLNNYPALIPNVYVKDGYYANGNLVLDIVNTLGAGAIALQGNTASTEGGTRVDYNNYIKIPSDQSLSRITIPIANIFDIGFNITNDMSVGTDVLYYADGPWGTDFDPSGASVSNFTIDGQNNINYSNCYNLNRNATVNGSVQTYASLFRVLKAGNKPVDVTNYKYIEFNASGSGMYTLTLSKKSIPAWSDQYRTTVNLTSTLTHYKIDLASLYNSVGLQNFSANDVVSVVFTKNGNNTSSQNFNIIVNNLHFSGLQAGINENMAVDNFVSLTTYPNPFKQTTTISFNLSKSSNVKLSVYDLEGKLIRVLTDEKYFEGIHDLQFDGAELKSGIYIVRLETKDIFQYKKIILMR